MRIAFFHELSDGGARRSVREFGKALKKSHIVDLYFVDSKNIKDAEAYFTNTYFFRFKERKWVGKDWKTRLYKDSIELCRLYLLHRNIAKIINSREYDFVFVEPSRFTQAPFILRFLRNSIYYSQEPLRMIYDPAVNSTDSIEGLRVHYEALNRTVRKKIDKKNIQYSKKVLANSRFSRKNLRKAYGINADVSYMGVDSNVFRPKNRIKDVDILYIGAYDSVDGIGFFDEVVKKIKKPVSVKILAREKKWIRSDDDLCDVYNSARVTVCISYNEPFGLIPLESMACGTPVVALNQGGYRETIKNGKTGFLVKKSTTDFAAMIENALKDREKLIKMGRQARKDMVDNWQWEKGAQAIEDYAKKVFSK